MPSSEYKIEAILAKEGMVRAAAEVDKALAGIDKRIDEIGKSGDDIRRKTAGPGGFLGISDKDLQNLESKLRDVSQGLSTVGTGLTAFGVAVTGGLAVAAQRAISFESAFAGVRKTVDASEAEFAELRDRFTELSEEIPVSASELARIGETAGQLGIRGVGNISEFTRTIADLGVASNVTGEEGATMLARFANVTGDDRYRQLANVIVDLGNNSATTEAEILTMAQRLASAGTTAGLSSDQILGMAAALSSVGIEAEAGGTAFSKLTIEIANAVADGGSKLQQFADVAGVSGQAFAQQFRENGAQAIAAFTAGLGRIQKEGGNVFAILDKMGLSEVRLRNAILATSNAQDKFTGALDRSALAITNTNALNQESQRFYATTENQIKILLNTIDNLAIEIGGALLPSLQGFAQSAKEVIVPIREWAQENPVLVKSLVEIVAVIGGGALAGSGLILLAAQLAGALANLIPLITGTGAAAATSAVSIRTLTLSFLGTGGLIAAVTAGAAAWLIYADNKREALEEQTRQNHDLYELVKALRAAGVAQQDLNKDFFTENAEQYRQRIEALAVEHGILEGKTEDASDATKQIKEILDQASVSATTFGKSSSEASKALDLVNETLSVFRGAADAARASREDSARIEAQNAAALAEVEGKMQAVNQRLKELAAASRESEQRISDFNRALFETVTAQTQLGSTMGSAGKAGLEALGTAALFARNEYGELTGATVEVAKATTNARDPIQQISTAITDLGKEIADFVIEGGRLIDVFAEFGKTLLRILTENLLGRIIGQLGQLIGLIPGLKGLGGIFSGSVGGGGIGAGGLAGVAGGLGLTAIGGPILGGLLGGQSGGALGAVLGAGAGAFGVGAASGIAAGAGFGALSPLAALGPVGLAIFGGAVGVTAIAKLLSKSVAEKFSDEFARDFGNVRVPEDTIRQFVANIGLDEKALEPIRKDIASSPLFLGLGFHLAEMQGQVEEFLTSLENVGNVFGSADFRSAFEFGQITGDFSFLNDKFVELFGSSTELVRLFGQDLKPLLIDMGEEFEPLADRITKMTDAGSHLETVFAKFAPEIILFLDTAEKTGLVLPPVIEQFREMAEATEGLSQFQLDLLSNLKLTREYFPIALADMAENIELLKTAGASTDEVIFLLNDDIEFLVKAAVRLGLEIPPVVQDMYNLANATEEVDEEMSAAAKTGKIWADTLGLVGDAAVSFTSGFESVFTSAEDAANQVHALTGEFAGLVTLMEGNGLDTLTAQERAWGLLGNRIIDAYNDTVLFGGEVDPLLKALIDLGIEFGLISIGVDGFAKSLDEAAGKMRVINGEWVAMAENIEDVAAAWGQSDFDLELINRLGLGGEPPAGPTIDPNHPFFRLSGAEIPPGYVMTSDGVIVRDVPGSGRTRGASIPGSTSTNNPPTVYLLPTPGGLDDLQDLVNRSRRIPSFAVGGLMTHDGLAYLHAGERVIPAGSTTNNSNTRFSFNMNITIGGGTNRIEAREAAREFAKTLERELPQAMRRQLKGNRGGMKSAIQQAVK